MATGNDATFQPLIDADLDLKKWRTKELESYLRLLVFFFLNLPWWNLFLSPRSALVESYHSVLDLERPWNHII